MKTIRFTALVAATAMLGLATARADHHEGEKSMKLEEVPEAVKAALQKEAGDATISDVSKEKEDGAEVYEATLTADGKTREVEFSADGKLLESEEKIALADAPEAVQKALKEKAAGGEIDDVEKHVTADGTTTYEAEIEMAGDKEIEVTVSADGKILPGEKEEKGEKDDD